MVASIIYLIYLFFSISFASGRSNSLILDSGAASTIAVPVHDGYTL